MNAKQTLVMDIECYINYFLVKFMHVEKRNVREYEMSYDDQDVFSAPLDLGQIQAILRNFRIVTFNGMNYDMPMLTLAMVLTSRVRAGTIDVPQACRALKEASDHIIVGNLRSWQFEQHYDLLIPKAVDHIDLAEVAPGVMISLKQYGARMHSRKLQDLPIEPSAQILPDQRALMRSYCSNDLETTIDLWDQLSAQIKLREAMSEMYGLDLRSKSDAQIAEAVLKSEIEKVKGHRIYKPDIPPGKTYHYKAPSFVAFRTQQLRTLLADIEAAAFVIGANGQPQEPPALKDREILIGDAVYRCGLGGLHSSETTTAHFADADTVLLDRDVASYYPAIIINCRLYPQHMGEAFLKVYKDILDRRIRAKRTGDTVTANSLKITLNGTFGKLGSKYSVLYAPDLMLQVTITGQLALLMLIETLDDSGIPVVSANTDGIVIKCPKAKRDRLAACIGWWEKRTGFDTEETAYRALFSRDVNNYIALKEGKGSKAKGAFTSPGLMKNPQHEICNLAVADYLEYGTPIEDTIIQCDDVRKFITVRQVNGGGTFGGQYLGKVVRWVYGYGETQDIRYKKPNKTGNFNKVAGSDGAIPLMELPEHVPVNLDYGWYIREAHNILRDIGAVQ